MPREWPGAGRRRVTGHRTVVGITEFRDGEVVRERVYPGDPGEPPSWRTRWVERFDPRAPGSSAGA